MKIISSSFNLKNNVKSQFKIERNIYILKVFASLAYVRRYSKYHLKILLICFSAAFGSPLLALWVQGIQGGKFLIWTKKSFWEGSNRFQKFSIFFLLGKFLYF